jgi:Uma2 family endonuclease
MKVRIQLPSHVRFYYPDAMVVCQPNPDGDSFQDHPRVVIEAISESTRRLDLGEKREGYLSIASLASYWLVEQDQPTVVAYQRTEQGFERRVYQGLDAVVELTEIGCQLPLAEIYGWNLVQKKLAIEGG